MKLLHHLLLYFLVTIFIATNLFIFELLFARELFQFFCWLALEVIFLYSLVYFLKIYFKYGISQKVSNLGKGKIVPEAGINQTEKLKYEAVLANIGDGLIVTDKTGNIITFNKAAESLLGWPAQEAAGKHLQDVVKIQYGEEKFREDAALTDFEPNRVTSKSAAGDYSLYFVRRNGTKFPAATTVTSYTEGDEVLGTITLFRDVTTEKNIDSMKTEFISLASHQLKTPLSAIRWYTEMLIAGDAGQLQPKQGEFAANINTSTLRMIDLVNALLNISRIETGKIIVEAKPTDLKKLVDTVVADVKFRADEKKQNLKVEIPDNLPEINIDQNLIRQVYMNLLTNGIKYTQGGGEISLSIAIKEGDIVSEVKDNGYGIPEEEKARVFDKFYRGNNIRDTERDGTGLGLYLVKAIVEISKGKIWYKSEVNHGTTFWFSLPIAGNSTGDR
ncbi:MAG TPA: ATP-binding protein [Patescibacteria group bacterium]|nr:ATP-binding protein [Patescibacteria group bacterium]